MEEFILRHWLTAAMAGVAAFFATLYAKAARQSGAVRRGVQALLRDRIYEACHHYEEKGHMPIYARENVEAMLAEYKNLGGNGTLEQRVGTVLAKLPYQG